MIDPLLRQVEQTLRMTLETDSPSLHPIIEHLLKSRGKRTRPLLVLLCGDVVATPKKQLVDLAVAVEILHMASLIHDDVVDQSSLRRNQPTIHSIWGNKAAILVGDYFFGKLMLLISNYPSVLPYFADVMQSLVLGEFMQIDQQFDPWLPEALYFERIYHKTAHFISICCKIGSISVHAPAEIRDSLTQFGLNLGMAYQLLDDLQDFIATSDSIGKPVLQDSQQGIFTLPFLHAFRNHPQFREQSPSLRPISYLPDESIAYGKKIVQQYLEHAIQSLTILPDSESKTNLIKLVHQMEKQIVIQSKISDRRGDLSHAPAID